MESRSLTVGQLNFYVKSLIEGDVRLADISVTGEISNFKNHFASGHLYFTLKDPTAQIRCVMFRAYASSLAFAPEDGMTVTLRGRVSLYEKDGQYQFYAEQMTECGKGDINARFEMVKKKLSEEGLFDAETKRALPEFPKKIAVITSADGAAVRDIINILTRRWPLCEVLLCPVTVQGETAPGNMIKALESIYGINDIDLAIIGRGGGSAEDLAAFNDEALARKIYESPFPIISAVGHETDFSISDFVADLRAPTPSAAAELAVPDIAEIHTKLHTLDITLKKSLKSKLEVAKLKYDGLMSKNVMKNPTDAILRDRTLLCDNLYDKMLTNLKDKISISTQALVKSATKLDSLSPLKVLARGFAVVTDADNNAIDEQSIKVDDILNVRLKNTKAECKVTSVRRDKNE